MSLRLKVAHRSTYTYSSEVVSSYNEARLVPQTGLSQLTLSSAVTTSPSAVQHRYWDYWGTQVTVFDVHVPHASLEVTCTSTVDTGDASDAPRGSWDDVSAAACFDLVEPVGECRQLGSALEQTSRRGRRPVDTDLRHPPPICTS